MNLACNHPHLLCAKAATDKEAIFSTNTQTPRKPKKVVSGGHGNPVVLDKDDEDIDDMANMLGGLSVGSKECEICQADLTKDQVQNKQVRCSECDADVKSTRNMKEAKEKKEKRLKKPSPELERMMKRMEIADQKKAVERVKPRRQVILDSDDEEDDYPTNRLVDDEAEEASEDESGNEDDKSQPEEELSGSDDDDDTLVSSEDESSKSNFASSKVKQLLKVLRKEIAGGNKTIVFSNFTSMLDILQPFLDKEGMEYVRYDGSMRNDKREASLYKLKNDEECKILLCSLKCGALGLNLTAANRVVILEPFWNPVSQTLFKFSICSNMRLIYFLFIVC